MSLIAMGHSINSPTDDGKQSSKLMETISNQNRKQSVFWPKQVAFNHIQPVKNVQKTLKLRDSAPLNGQTEMLSAPSTDEGRPVEARGLEGCCPSDTYPCPVIILPLIVFTCTNGKIRTHTERTPYRASTRHMPVMLRDIQRETVKG
jgi:hypothetical protein